MSDWLGKYFEDRNKSYLYNVEDMSVRHTARDGAADPESLMNRTYAIERERMRRDREELERLEADMQSRLTVRHSTPAPSVMDTLREWSDRTRAGKDEFGVRVPAEAIKIPDMEMKLDGSDTRK